MSFSMSELSQETPQPQATPAPQTAAPASQPNTVNANPPSPNAFSISALTKDDHAQSEAVENDPRQTGEIVNDVDQKVIVPKDGENFSDTLKRAIAYHKSLTPEQQQAVLDAEAKTMPKKTVQTLGAAATIGAVGPALLAAPGEIAEALPSVLTHTAEGVRALNAWAIRNPVSAIMLYHAVKELMPGAKKAMGIIKATPIPE
jgi:hypothetical protein